MGDAIGTGAGPTDEAPTDPMAGMAMQDRLRVGRVLRKLAGWSTWVLFAVSLAWFAGWTVVARVVLEAVVPAVQQDQAAQVAEKLISALGALFAFVTGFVITTEWAQHRDAEGSIGHEAEAAVRLAWASGWPGVDGPLVRRDLAAYLRSVLDVEWPTLARGAEDCPETTARLRALRRRVRMTIVERPLDPPVAADLLQAAEAVAVARADRLNLATRDLPLPLVALSFVSGVVFVLAAVTLALRIDDWVGVVIAAVVVLVALDLALVVSIAAPFRGSLRVRSRPLERVLDDVRGGRFGDLDVPARPAPDDVGASVAAQAERSGG